MSRRDDSIADDAIARKALMCTASGCPQKWSVDAGNGRCCSAHAWADKVDWPRITQDLLDAEADQALAAAAHQPPAAPLTQADKLAILERLRAIDFTKQGGKAWARALKAREEAGERLTLAQKTMWREALGLPITGAIPTWEQTPEEFAAGHP